MLNKGFDSIHLLLVDDEADFRNALTKRLSRRGIVTEQAESGRAALESLSEQAVDVVVLDVKMPGLNGIEVLHGIKERFPGTEVILLTGHSDTRDGIEGIKSGAFDYLTKPIEFEHLLGKIKQAHEKKIRDQERRQEVEYKAHIEQQMITTERLAALGTLAAGVAHEINNPLAIINESAGYISTLLAKPELEGMPRRKDFDKALEKIINGVKRARAITHQLLGSVSKQEPLLARVGLEELMAEAIQLVAKEAANKDIAIHAQVPATMPEIWLDPNQVRQILINLLTNAIHATGRQGQITIRIDQAASGFVLTVADTGKGIPKENLEKIFEPFFSDKPPGQGTGLGLFVTRQIVEKMGGSIAVESRVGVGTTMTIAIPAQNPEHSEQK